MSGPLKFHLLTDGPADPSIEAMDILLNYLHSGFSAVVPFVILLGLLIFVHELGHFAVAKWCGVRVEVFSLGFGKKILSYKKGDTLYCISLIPLGGYVKMFGDEVGAEISAEDKKHSFLHKNVWQRIAVVIAGPLMNFFFAIFVLLIVSFLGEDARQPIVGDVAVDSSVYQAGVRSGDKIISIADHEIRSWEELQSELNQHIGQSVKFKVQHNTTNEFSDINLNVMSKPNPNILSLDHEIGEVDGLAPISTAALVGIKSKTKAEVLGLQTGDRIVSINGQAINFFRELEPTLLGLQGQKVAIEVERFASIDTEKSEKISMDTVLPAFASLESLGIEKSDLYLSKIVADSPAAKAGLKAGDRLLQVNELVLKKWEDVLSTVKSYSGDGDLNVMFTRDGKIESVLLKPQMTEQTTVQGAQDKRYTIGIFPWVAVAPPETVKVVAGSLSQGLSRSIQRTWDITVMTVMSFIRLAQNKISPKNIGGVISIGQAASETFKTGVSQFLTMMAVISVNLFILNLLPIPVLDGGHLVFYTVEAIRGAPLSMRKMEIAQQVGLVLLMSLMVFALFNDFSRILGHH